MLFTVNIILLTKNPNITMMTNLPNKQTSTGMLLNFSSRGERFVALGS